MSNTTQLAIEGWLTLEPTPALIGTRCSQTGTYYFPPETTMSRAPGASSASLEEVRLSTAGKLWSYTNAGYQPPDPFIPQTDPFVPFCIAAVELELEQIVVLGQVIAGVEPDDLHIGMDMHLVIDVLYTEDGIDYLIWKWAPGAEQ
jgi:uncharacterized OB-fold protein